MLNPNPVGLLAAGLSLILCPLVWHWLQRAPIGKRAAAVFLFGLLALPGLSFSVYYLHALPETTAFYELRATRWTEPLVVPIGALCGSLAACWLPLRSLWFVATFAASLAPFCKPVIAPLSGAMTPKWKDNVCLQSTTTTCGPASMATILRNCGIDLTEHQIASESFTSARGTEAWYLARTVRRHGCSTRFDFAWELSPSAPMPMMVGVTLAGVGHFIPLLEWREGRYLIGDPLHGPERLTEKELRARYRFTNFSMSVSHAPPTPAVFLVNRDQGIE